ncbi:orotidine-5'-phosphate decarboxylase [Bifidobacterium callimiconis]|uniref:orotidine-5'-phosphate decarboxylase n=1 Tax=Bifidobacterium callimiconis TaxID=2306973 RepID=UPI001BDDB130|nr:orotidine-5'-phosphate decarboxylase [Bifidobacterium callimiconis]
MDRLIDAISAADNPSVVGLDPKPALLPKQLIDNAREATISESEMGNPMGTEAAWSINFAAMYLKFNTAIIDAVKDIVPAVKPQIAMYEALGEAGLWMYARTCKYAQDNGLYVLGDIKRGDIGSTAEAYAHHLSGFPLKFSDVADPDEVENVERNAEANAAGIDDAEENGDEFQFGSEWYEDAVTVNPYLGTDGITPFVDAAAAHDKDIFILVRTSNPSSSEIQELELANGGRVYEHVADLVEGWGANTIGKHGYSRTGAVVGATHPEEGARLRERMPHTFFLVPGYGAQGGTAADVARMFDTNGSGAIVNSSRGIIGAWKKNPDYNEDLSIDDALAIVAQSARTAALAMREDLNSALKEARR